MMHRNFETYVKLLAGGVSDPTLTLRGQGNIRSTATIVYFFVRRSRKRLLG
jgi:hypothetical protein